MKWRVRQWARTRFPIVPHDPGSVLAVKGSLRRFAPWTAPVRSERRRCFTRGKGGCGSASDFVSHLIAFDKGSAQNRANLYAKPFASHETAVELVLAVA